MRKSVKAKYKAMQDSNELIGNYKENRCIIYNLHPIVSYYLMLCYLLRSDTQPNNGSKYSGLKFVFTKKFYARNSVLREYIDKNNFIIDVQDSNYYNTIIGSSSFIMTDHKTHDGNNNNRFYNQMELIEIIENVCNRGLKLYYIIPINCYTSQYEITADSLANYQGNSGSINEWCYIDQTMQYLKRKLHYPIYRVIIPFMSNPFLESPFQNYLSEQTPELKSFGSRNVSFLSSSKIDLEDHITERDYMSFEKIAECLYYLCQDSQPKNYLIGTDTKVSYNEISYRDKVKHKLIPSQLKTNTDFIKSFNIENLTRQEYLRYKHKVIE